MKRWKRISIWILSVIIILSIIYLHEILFLTSLISDQVSLISKSEPIPIALNNQLVPEEIKKQLAFVPTMMAYGNQLGFPPTDAYSTYIQLPREVFLHSLSAAKKDSFEEYKWHWPFIGALPYKGFIHKEDALQEEIKLKQLGYDTHFGESSAMSTLGLFADPIITTMILKNDSTVLINIIFHERTHQLFFRPNDVTFNENAATLIGAITALEFIKQEFGEQSLEYQHQKQRMHDQIVFSEFINDFYQELAELYQSMLSLEEKIKEREQIFQKYKQKFKMLKEKELQYYFQRFAEKEINNAYLLSYYRYYGKLHLYYQIYEKLGTDVSQTIEFFKQVAEGKEGSENAIRYYISGESSI